MNISLNKAGDLEGRLTVAVSPADYAEKVEAKLKDYRKKASIKGFRPGMVPAALVKKLYGQSALVDEINHMLGHEVSDYIKENALEDSNREYSCYKESFLSRFREVPHD